jgi:hypothetical protein
VNQPFYLGLKNALNKFRKRAPQNQNRYISKKMAAVSFKIRAELLSKISKRLFISK